MSGPLSRCLLTCALATFGASATLAQRPITPSDTGLVALSWRMIGPFRGGRSVAVAGSSARPLEYYTGTTGGGVFKTTNAGVTWFPVSDKYFGGSIGAVAVSASNPDVVYVGTGEYAFRGNMSLGEGVYKTTNAGRSWTFLGLRDTRQISRVLVHPTNPDVVYVGALGHAFGPNPDRGLYRSTDGGASWKKILFRGDSAGIWDVVMDPSDARTLYASTYQVLRKPWDIVSGGAGSALFKSADGGDTWTDITRNPGLPVGLKGTIAIAVSPARTSLVWALIEADSGGLYRSDDAGGTWRRVNRAWEIRRRPYYFSRVFADPKDTNVLYLPTYSLMKSVDGGVTFKDLREYNDMWDSHEFWIDPTDPKRFIVGADLGARVTNDGGVTLSYNEYPAGQFYHVATTNHVPYYVCGAQQDSRSWCGPSRARGVYDLSAWYYAGAGESQWLAPSPTNPDITYSSERGLKRIDRITGEAHTFEPWPERPGNVAAAKMKYRWNWTTPLIISPHDPRVIYVGSNVLFKTTDEGRTWSKVSGDLTRADPRTLGVPGGPISPEFSGPETYATIFAIAESPVQRGVIWTGSDDGLVQVTRDGGVTWRNVTPPNLGEWGRISIIDASHFSAGAAYVAANRYQVDDNQPYIYKTSDYGQTWTRITSGIPADEFVRVVREDPVRRGLLFAGTERGVWFSFDDGASWKSLSKNLPAVPVHDLVVKDADLVIATHGRAFWIMDDISPLRELNPAIAAKASHLFAPARALRAFWSASPLMETHPLGTNPASGAWLYYWLKDAGHDVTLDILDTTGRVVRSFSSRPDSALASEKRAPNKAGLSVFQWDFRSAVGEGLTDSTFETPRTPAIVQAPGRYTARLTVDGDRSTAQSRSFVVLKDPSIASTQADLDARVAFGNAIRSRVTSAIVSIKELRRVKAQLAQRVAQGDGATERSISVRAMLDSLSAVERALVTPIAPGPPFWHVRVSGPVLKLSQMTGNLDYAPTAAERAVVAEISAQIDRELTRLKRFMGPGRP